MRRVNGVETSTVRTLENTPVKPNGAPRRVSIRVLLFRATADFTGTSQGMHTRRDS
jgi:hypothetical protein